MQAKNLLGGVMKLIRTLAVIFLACFGAGCQNFMNGAPFGASVGPPWMGVDLDCSDVRKRVWVGQNDPHRLDGDGDGWGCEAY